MGDTYTLRLLVDDSQVRSLEARLNKMMGLSGKPAAATGGKGATGEGGGGGNAGIAKNIAKIGGIALAVGGIMAMVNKIGKMVVQSSPMLQAMLKLFNTAILFIFRPIGDFIGFMLRPLMLYFLLQIALPWYKMSAPILRGMGTDFGNKLVKFLDNPFASFFRLLDTFNFSKIPGIGVLGVALDALVDMVNKGEDKKQGIENGKEIDAGWGAGAAFPDYDFGDESIGGGLFPAAYGDSGDSGTTTNSNNNNNDGDSIDTKTSTFVTDMELAFETLKTFFTNAPSTIEAGWITFASSMGTIFTNLNTDVGTAFDATKTFFSGVKTSITETVKPAWDSIATSFDGFKSMISLISTTFTNGLIAPLNGITTFFTGVKTAITDTVQPAWDSLSGFFGNIQTAITDTVQPAWDSLSGIWKSIADFFKPVFEAIEGLLGFFGIGAKKKESSGSTDSNSRSDRDSGNISITINDPHVGTAQGLADFEQSVLDVIEKSGRSRFRT